MAEEYFSKLDHLALKLSGDQISLQDFLDEAEKIFQEGVVAGGDEADVSEPPRKRMRSSGASFVNVLEKLSGTFPDRFPKLRFGTFFQALIELIETVDKMVVEKDLYKDRALELEHCRASCLDVARDFLQIIRDKSVVQFLRKEGEEITGKGEQFAPFNSRYYTDFDELGLLGEGGFGSVFKCQHLLDGETYAVKKVPFGSESADDRENVLREVKILSKLNHPNVVRYYQAWIENGVFIPLEDDGFDAQTACLYVQMELCDCDLKDKLTRKLDAPTAWSYFRQIVTALEYVHGEGFIHRDLSKGNIFFRSDVLKVGDFGAVKCLGFGASKISGTEGKGTYPYVAPELDKDEGIDHKVDIYSLGIILFELFWEGFGSAMGQEKDKAYTDLKKSGVVPPGWGWGNENNAILLRRLISEDPSCRPSATEILKEAPWDWKDDPAWH